MSILEHLNPIGGAIEKTGSALDELFTSDEERLLARIELEKLKLEFERAVQSARSAYESELTARHASDMRSDSRFSKLIRPASLVFLLGAIVTLAVTDGNIAGFQIKQAWVDLLQILGTTAFMFYFGGRSVEKWKK